MLLLALEKVPDAMVVAMERVVEQGIPNVRFLDRDAELLPEMFAPGEISRLYINFPDPWPKKKQFKRRLTAPEFLDKYRALLPEGGAVWFKTDNGPLFDWSLESFRRLRLGACRYAGGHAHDRLRSALHRDGPSHPPRCGDAPIRPYGKNRKRGARRAALSRADGRCDGRLIPALCRKHGAALATSEMISSKALMYQDGKTKTLLVRPEGDTPLAVQIFGSDPSCMAEAACKVIDLCRPRSSTSTWAAPSGRS